MKQGTLLSFIHSVVSRFKTELTISVMLSVFLALTRGGSFVALLPLLQLAGIGDQTAQSSKAGYIAQLLWQQTGIQFNLYIALLVNILLVLTYALLGYIQTLTSTRIVQQYKQQLRTQLFTSVIQAEWAFLKKKRGTDIYQNLITETGNVEFGVHLVMDSISRLILLVVYTATSLYISIPMALVATGCFIPLLILQKTFNRKVHQKGEQLYSRHQRLFSIISEYVQSLKLAKSYNLQPKYLADFSAVTSQEVQDNIAFARLQAATSLLHEAGIAVIVSLLLVGAVVILRLPALDLLMMIFLASRLMPNMSTLARNHQYLIGVMPSYEGLTALLKEAGEQEEKNISHASPLIMPQSAIRFEGVTFGYDQATTVLENFTAEIRINTTVRIQGESGSGKTTFIELLLGLIKPDHGQIWIDNRELATLDLAQWRSMIAYIPQESFLFHSSVRENLTIFQPNASDQDLAEVLSKVSGEFVYQLPQGLDTLIGDQGCLLSGGEKQRLVLARALLRQPKLLIMDEATNALDPDNERIIYVALQKLRYAITILIVAHSSLDPHAIDKVIYLKKVKGLPIEQPVPAVDLDEII